MNPLVPGSGWAHQIIQSFCFGSYFLIEVTVFRYFPNSLKGYRRILWDLTEIGRLSGGLFVYRCLENTISAKANHGAGWGQINFDVSLEICIKFRYEKYVSNFMEDYDSLHDREFRSGSIS